MKHAHKHHGAEDVYKGKKLGASCDMNVTPLIDVLLVLLVIFLAALPLTQKGLDINLPAEAKNQPKQTQPDTNQIVLEITADHKISVNKQDVAVSDLEDRLTKIFAQRSEKTMFIIGAPSLPYSDIVTAIDAAKGAGVDKVGIVTTGMQRAAGGQPGS